MTNEQVTAALQHLIGTHYASTVKTYISSLTQRTRVVGPTDTATMEFDDQRIHIVANAEGIIEGFRFA